MFNITKARQNYFRCELLPDYLSSKVALRFNVAQHLLRDDLMSARQRLSCDTTQTDGQACNFVKTAPIGALWSAP